VVPSSVTLAPGDTQALSATVSGGGAVVWAASGGAITPAGVYTAPAQVGTYTIVTSNGTHSGSAIVNVTNLPIIQSYSASPLRINSAGTTTLSWAVKNAISLKLDPGTGPVDVTGQTRKVMSPKADTSYALTASNAFGSVVQSVRVGVVFLPAITSFTATPSKVGIGDMVTLNWATTGADVLVLDPGSQNVTGYTWNYNLT
jgi:hypothetical protein